MSLRLRRHNDQDHHETDQRAPERELRNRGQDPAVAVPEEGEDVDDLVSHKDHPWGDDPISVSVLHHPPVTLPLPMKPLWKGDGKEEDIQIRIIQLNAPHSRTPHRERHTGTREDTPRPRKPPRQITRKVGPPRRRQLIRPEILSARIGQCRRQFRQRYADAGGDQGDQDDAVDNADRPAGVDAGDEGGGDAEPGVGEGEADAEDGPDGEFAAHVLFVAHLCEKWLVGCVMV